MSSLESLLSRVHSVGRDDDLLGGMWAKRLLPEPDHEVT
jgi:hypothetical protein